MATTEYHKINSVFKRDPANRNKTFMFGQYADPAFEYLADCQWAGTEKIDGTNIRIEWSGSAVSFGGKSDNAQIPAKLVEVLRNTFTADKMLAAFGDRGGLTLYGEGYGAGIQSGGNYRPDQSFILFDIAAGGVWFEQAKVTESASALGIDMVARLCNDTLTNWVSRVREGFKSRLSDTMAEGVVLRPQVELRDRLGDRVITKLKHKDFI